MKKGIFKALAFPFPFKGVKIDVANEYILEAAEHNQDMIIPLLLIKPDLTVLENSINRVAGLKEHFYFTEDVPLNEYDHVYDFLQQHNLILLIHPHMKERIERISYIKKNFPKLKVILAHSGRKWIFTGDDVIDIIVPKLKKFEHLYFETSSIRDSKTVAELVNKVGAERVLFGSDFPCCQEKEEDLYFCEFEMIENAKLSDDIKEKIFITNFREIFLKNYWIRRVSKKDHDVLLNLINGISSQERKFLAIDKKMAVVKDNIRRENHIFILENTKEIIGFVRESGRSENGAVIEEIFIKEQFRQKGYGKHLLLFLCGMFDWLSAKTYTANKNICTLFEKSKFRIQEKTKKGTILNWFWTKK
ncbi:MAG: hypothetical protein BWK80_04760 [Desulfobacteraceae bacterium IS3]|nr:MAG: hypothetical protein BWK80_04760 [Desulfobacteraceae bacterium IS3]